MGVWVGNDWQWKLDFEDRNLDGRQLQNLRDLMEMLYDIKCGLGLADSFMWKSGSDHSFTVNSCYITLLQARHFVELEITSKTTLKLL
ncbi:unnamed protein product [Lathyrus sativus]|nr:unnamed protein product [Lathyrus sativus]